MRNRSMWCAIAGLSALTQIAPAQTVRPREPAPIRGSLGPTRPTPAAPGRGRGTIVPRVLPGAYYIEPYLLPPFGGAYDPYAFAYPNGPYPLSGDYALEPPYVPPIPYFSPYATPYAPAPYAPAAPTNPFVAPFAYNSTGGGLTIVNAAPAITMLPGGAAHVDLGDSSSAVIQPCAPLLGAPQGSSALPLFAPVRPASDSAGRPQPYALTGALPSAAQTAAAPAGGAACWGLDESGRAVVVWP
ncbi:MAG TPA: hypothetical protein VMH39_09405 [Gemmatimonadaceae bacterium]|nr:hypothetical protein [Gemmatimonadaceae bacterium]